MALRNLSSFCGKRIVLLQGPVGPFFRRLADDLRRVGAQVHKVNFNGGDWAFFARGAHNFRGTAAQWPAYFEALLADHDIEMVLLFGDCRPLHREAHRIAEARGLEVGVFEEGYLRPDYVTLERFGVNAHSRLMRRPIQYLNAFVPVPRPARGVGNTFAHTALWAFLYYFFAGLMRPLFARYRHHRPLGWGEAVPWIRSAWRRQCCALREFRTIRALGASLRGRYFLVPLQLCTDSQIVVHSAYDSVPEFIDSVIRSFAEHADAGHHLVIKHHPLDRGYHDYRKLIDDLARRYGMAERCHYVHDPNLPMLIKGSLGVVLVNSTVGMSALHHGRPLKVCGSAIYDMQGLTFQGELDAFWQRAPDLVPDAELLERFRDVVIARTQLNGSFYRRLPGAGSATGIVWDCAAEISEPAVVAVQTDVRKQPAGAAAARAFADDATAASLD